MASGTVFKYGDNVDTDVIIPARYLNDPSLENMAAHCMEDIDTEFVNKLKTAILWWVVLILVVVHPVSMRPLP